MMRVRYAPTAVIAVLAIAAASCGRVGLDRGADGGADPAGVVDAAHETLPLDAPVDLPPTGPPFAIVVRLTNVGAGDFRLFLRPTDGCSDDLLIQGDAPFDTPASLQDPDVSCDCATCVPGTPFRCQSTEFICDEPPVVLAPGAHFDYGWGGIAQVWRAVPPPGSSCPGRCSAFVAAAAGRYTFTLQQPVRAYSAETPLPAPGGVVEIAVGAP